jgi:hypothetical protein
VRRWQLKLENSETRLFIVFRIALFDVDIITPTCSYTAWNGLHVFALMLLLPLSAALRYGAQYALSTRHKTAAERVELREAAFGNFLSFVVGAQASQIRQCLLVFSCRHIQGNGLVLYTDLSVECGGTTLLALRVVGIVYLTVVIVGATSAVGARVGDAGYPDRRSKDGVIPRRTHRTGARRKRPRARSTRTSSATSTSSPTRRRCASSAFCTRPFTAARSSGAPCAS